MFIILWQSTNLPRFIPKTKTIYINIIHLEYNKENSNCDCINIHIAIQKIQIYQQKECLTKLYQTII